MQSMHDSAISGERVANPAPAKPTATRHGNDTLVVTIPGNMPYRDDFFLMIERSAIRLGAWVDLRDDEFTGDWTVTVTGGNGWDTLPINGDTMLVGTYK
jgi:hypothetical protein